VNAVWDTCIVASFPLVTNGVQCGVDSMPNVLLIGLININMVDL